VCVTGALQNQPDFFSLFESDVTWAKSVISCFYDNVGCVVGRESEGVGETTAVSSTKDPEPNRFHNNRTVVMKMTNTRRSFPSVIGF